MSIAKIGGIPVPYVYAIVIEREVIGDEGRTAGGKLRRDVVAVKRTWRLQTRPMTKAEATAITNHLDARMYSNVYFWLNEFGDQTNAILVYVDIDEEEIVQFGNPGWQRDGRQLTMTIREQ